MEKIISAENYQNELKKKATDICKPAVYTDLLDFQLSYWLCVQKIMCSSGYIELRKRMPQISKELAYKIEKATIPELLRLCSAEICTMMPSIDEGTIESMINPAGYHACDSMSQSKMALKLLRIKR